jgi:transcription elongation factor GreA
VVVALRTLGGEAKPRDLKRRLSPDVVPAEGWSAWWKRARAALEEDERIDLSQSFRDLVRLAEVAGDGDQVALPNLTERGDLGRQLKLLRRFLEQHPDARERAGRAHGRRLERWLETRSLTHEDRILILILINEWDPEARVRLRDGLVEVCRHGFSLAAFPEERDQQRLLELGLEAEEWQPVAMAGLDSKQLLFRQRVLALVEERLGAESTRFYRNVLEKSPAYGDAVIEVARGALSDGTPALAAAPAVDLFIALLRLVSEPERETLRKYAQGFLDPDGRLFVRLASEPAEGPGVEMIELALLNFRASDKHLFPILAALERIWGSKVIEAFRRRRERESQLIAARMDDDEGELPVGLLTRASLDALKAEAQRIDLELRTTIPRAIQLARELGDLSENAEYESAKLKQRNANERLVQLQQLISDAQVIEDQPVDESCVQAGTEVTLEPLDGAEALVYWILGDGDSHHGPDVVSYRAELGRALWRRRPGDEIELPLAQGTRHFKIGQIKRRLPS